MISSKGKRDSDEKEERGRTIAAAPTLVSDSPGV